MVEKSLRLPVAEITDKTPEDIVAELQGRTAGGFHLPLPRIHISGLDGYIHDSAMSALDAQRLQKNREKRKPWVSVPRVVASLRLALTEISSIV